MKKVILSATLLLASSSALAANMPRFDVESHCKEVAAFGGEYSNMVYNGCIDMEQSSYSSLKGTWPHLPSSLQDHCLEVARFGGPGSYSTLKGCVDMEVSAANNKKSFSFD